MKTNSLVIGIVMGIALAACSPSVKVPETVEGPSPELSSIDSLMWRRPDSAYAMLKEFVVSPEAKELDAFNGHYCQLLISELLYKNDWGQSNRGELLKAVGYFDSIVDLHGEDVQKRNAFLDARAHYINGVGFYEQDDLVNACAEYLKTLEVMEKHFEEKELVEHKARFLAYTYNRLGDMFSEQFMMESAIKCYESALFYCKIEPTSSSGISNVLYRIGKQYDKKGEKSKAHEYYTMALEKMPSRNNLLFRDLVSTKALCEYKLGYSHKQSLDKLKQVLMLADNESEHLFRFLIIGGIYYEEKVLDSALYYLEPVFKNDVDIGLRAEAANTLRTIYESIGDEENANSCISFLVENKKLDWENKSLVSKLEGMYKTYMDQKQQKEADEEREMSIRKTIEIFVPIAIIMALAVFIVVKLRSKKLLKKQQDETKKEAEQTHKRHASELEAERVAYQKEQEALRQSLRQREAQVNALETALVQQREGAERRREAFLKEPICQRILGQVRSKPITTRENAFELGVALKDEDFEQLRAAVEKHYPGFDHVLLSHCPSLKHGLISLCHLHLLGINESEIAVLKNVSYSAIKKQNDSLQEKLGIKDSVSKYVFGVAEGLVGHADDVLKGDSLREMQESSQKNSQKNSQKIVDLIKERPEITTAEMAEIIGITRRSIVNITNRLQEEGVIRRVGPDKGGHWEVIG